MKRFLSLSVLLVTTLAQAVDTAYAPPVGGMTVAVPAGQTRSVTLPLVHPSVASGAILGKITAVGSNYLEDTSASWVAGELSTAANPYYLRIKTGAAAGRVLLVSTTANTAIRVNLTTDGLNLDVAGGPAVGDVYELVMADTLGTFFGSGTLQGGADALSADNVQIWGNTAWVSYYYNTTRNRWERSTDTGASATRDNIVLRPDRGVMIVRRAATPFTMYVTGRVPVLNPKHVHLTPGVTFFSNGLPVVTTLGGLGLQNSVPGWRGSTSGSAALTGADLLQIWGNTAWVYYYYDTARSSWQRSTDTGASASRDTVVLAAGQAFMLRRLDTAVTPADNFITVPLPYSIQQ